ncbi:hypothetical protein [Spirosoma radiotolerans]|uniref:Uncharacterized protein n=1 Tax=Spirosoma radiotolerans TaxID=1379870 RepID=A0A0E3ZX69_9BACT|nr:hypothetical protein [Spirosoma radiotolerans]AKD56200.1 hypothetical protein SD10_16150 [Spirosoma radiotolerans]
MTLPSTWASPGLYEFTYPTFVDTPQQICVHFLTPDGQQAFVSYPRHSNRKAAQMIPVSWFETVVMTPLGEQPCLMNFLETLFTGWFTDSCVDYGLGTGGLNELNTYSFSDRQAA